MTQRPPFYIPVTGQGLCAKWHQKGTEGGKEWLKYLKLHKYWPTFSQWSYQEFMSLNGENIDRKIREIGSTGITYGAKQKLVREIEMLRRREVVLARIPLDLSDNREVIHNVLDYLSAVVVTPVPRNPRSRVAVAIVTTLLKVCAIVAKDGEYKEEVNATLDSLIQTIFRRPVLNNTIYIIDRPEERKLEEASTKSVRRSIFPNSLSSGDDSGYGDLTFSSSSNSSHSPTTDYQVSLSPHHSTPVKVPLRSRQRRESESGSSTSSASTSVSFNINILDEQTSFGNISPILRNSTSVPNKNILLAEGQNVSGYKPPHNICDTPDMSASDFNGNPVNYWQHNVPINLHATNQSREQTYKKGLNNFEYHSEEEALLKSVGNLANEMAEFVLQ